MQELVRRFFVKTKDGRFVLNDKMSLNFVDMQEACRFLAAVIRYWHNKCMLFCYERTFIWKEEKRIELPEEKWEFGYKTPSTCSGCRRAQEILDKIFGSHYEFNALPFVTYHGDRYYSFPFELLKYFAEKGHESTVRLIEERKQEEARKKAEAEARRQQELREKQNAQLEKRLQQLGIEITEELREQILPYADNESLVVVNPRVAVVVTSRSEWGSVGGIGYYDQLRVFYNGKSDMKEWQWRDRYSASNDKPWLRIYGIGTVKVSEKEGRVLIEVEVINEKYGNRTVTFTFYQPEQTPVQIDQIEILSPEEQVAFIAKVERALALKMAELERLWEYKPKMLASYPPGVTMPPGTPRYVPYRRPSIKQKIVRPEIGVAAFVTEEQIDHRGSDPQIRHELYILTARSEKAEMVAEDHGYEREGGAFLTILELGPERIVINTKGGKRTITIR